MAQSIQHDPAALILELSAASTSNIHSPIASPGSQLHGAIVSIPLLQNIRQVSSHATRWNIAGGVVMLKEGTPLLGSNFASVLFMSSAGLVWNAQRVDF